MIHCPICNKPIKKETTYYIASVACEYGISCPHCNYFNTAESSAKEK